MLFTPRFYKFLVIELIYSSMLTLRFLKGILYTCFFSVLDIGYYHSLIVQQIVSDGTKRKNQKMQRCQIYALPTSNFQGIILFQHIFQGKWKLCRSLVLLEVVPKELEICGASISFGGCAEIILFLLCGMRNLSYFSNFFL